MRVCAGLRLLTGVFYGKWYVEVDLSEDGSYDYNFVSEPHSRDLFASLVWPASSMLCTPVGRWLFFSRGVCKSMGEASTGAPVFFWFVCYPKQAC